MSPRIRFDIVLNNLVAWAVTTALEAPEDPFFNQAFNVGSTAHNYRMRDIAEIVAEVMPGCRIEVAPDAGPDKRSYCVSFEKIARVLPAFKPQWDVRRGAEQLFAAYRRSGLILEEFEGRRYQRIGHIRRLIADGILTPDLRRSCAAGARAVPFRDQSHAVV